MALGAKTVGDPHPSILLLAPSGFGKTSFAEAIAVEMGVQLRKEFAGISTTESDICSHLQKLGDSDILFIDEAHSLRQSAQQILYMALDGCKIPQFRDDGTLNRGQFGSIASFTLILATNEPGGLKPALCNRLTPITFDSYSTYELKVICEKYAKQKYGIKVTPQAARRLAELSRGVPRTVCRQIETLRYLNPMARELNLENVEDMLACQGIDEFELDSIQRRYLEILVSSPLGICPLNRIEALLGTDSRNIRLVIEPFLVNHGFVNPHSTRGRQITEKGRQAVSDFSEIRATELNSPEN